MAPSNSVSVMPCDMLMGTPCFLMWLRIDALVSDLTGRYSSSGGLRASTHAWKNPTERALSDICFAHSLRSGGVKGDSGVALSNVGGVGRDKRFFNLEAPPFAILVTLFAEMGGHTILSCLGWDVLLLTCDKVSGRRPPRQLPPLGRLIVSGISIMVGPGASWSWFCHRVPCCPSDRRLLSLTGGSL